MPSPPALAPQLKGDETQVQDSPVLLNMGFTLGDALKVQLESLTFVRVKRRFDSGEKKSTVCAFQVAH